MDIRKLLKATCPLTPRHGFSNSFFGSAASFQSGLPNQRRSGFRRTAGAASFHTSNSYMQQFPRARMSDGCYRHTQHGHHLHQVRHKSTLYSSEHRASRSLPNRLLAPTFHSRSYIPNLHRMQKPSLLSWRQRQNNKASPLSAVSPIVARKSRVGATGIKSPDLAPFPALSLSNSHRSTIYRPKHTSKPGQETRLARQRRHIVEMHRYRLRRRLKVQTLSVPKHSSQLIGLNLNGKSSAAPIWSYQNRKNEKRAKQSKGTSSQRRMGTGGRYHHIHFYNKNGGPGRTRFLGFQHFLRISRMKSPQGQRAMKRAEAAMSLQTSTQNGNAKYSWQRPYVRKWRKHLKRLERYLKANDAQRAIHVARILFQVRNGGAKLPNGSQLLMLVKMDEEHYVGSLEASAVEEMSSPKRQQQLERFTVKDLNSILERCVNLEDMGNGLNISLILLERYRSMSFNFQSEISVPNSRTIDLLLTILLKCGQTNKMEKLLSCLHVRYPHPIPIYVYISFLDKLAHIPFYINLMESLLGHLQRNGPAPTAALHNTFLKAHAFRSGAKRAGDYLKCMLERNYSADQQSFRILIEASLKELDLVRAHYWLGEYARQGYEIMPKMMVPFMKTCVQQIVNTQHDDPISENGLFTDTSTSSKEWMHKALHLVQFMTNQRIQPTARTFELLIEGFLSQGRLTDAKSVLNQMRGSPHLYNPTLKTWRLFFDYYLEVNNPSLALRILKQMRHELLLRPFKNTSAVVPTRLYHQFFRYLLQRGRLSRAESSLYEMMINQHRRQPTEREVADLIWKLDQHPEAAERVYELLYSQARKPGFSMTTIDPATKHFRKNRILENGPIQMANVGLMRARAISSNENLHREVWNAWNDMTEKFIEQHGLHSSSTQRHMPVLASAFEQVAIASRKSLLKSHAAKVKNQAIDMLEQEHNRTEGNRVASGWDFGRVRRNLGPGLGLGLGLDLSGGASVTSGMSRTLESKNKSQLLIQQLLQRKEVLKPLLDHQRVAESRGAALSTLSGTSDITAEADINDVRLRNLKSSFEWVQAHEIPIRIEGLNAYIASLLSHNEFDEAKACAERFFLSSAYTNSAVPEGKISSDSTLKTSPLPSFSPNVATIQLFYDQRSQISDEIVHRLLYKGGHKLVSEWNKCLKIPAPKIEPM